MPATETQVKEAAESINSYIEQNLIRLADVIKENPISIKTEVAAKLLGVGKQSMQTYLKNGGNLGVAWKKDGKQNYGMSVPTFPFLCKAYGIGIINIVKEYM